MLYVTLPDGTLIEYVHDPLGRRIAKKINGTTVEKYLWQGLTQLLAVYDGSDNLLMRFEYADGRMPVSMTRSDGTYYLGYDQVGSLRVVADWNGITVKTIDYDSFGNIINDTDPSFAVPIGFAGGLYDPNTGLVRFGYRDYDPDVGRWTSKDPILFAGKDTDLYGYCLSDPNNFIDTFGLELTTNQKMISSIASGVGGLIGGLVGTFVFPGVGSAVGAAIGASLFGAAATSLQGGDLYDVGNSALTGAMAGYLGPGIGNLLSNISATGLQAAIRAGIATGVIKALLMGGDPLLKRGDNKACK